MWRLDGGWKGVHASQDESQIAADSGVAHRQRVYLKPEERCLGNWVQFALVWALMCLLMGALVVGGIQGVDEVIGNPNYSAFIRYPFAAVLLALAAGSLICIVQLAGALFRSYQRMRAAHTQQEWADVVESFKMTCAALLLIWIFGFIAVGCLASAFSETRCLLDSTACMSVGSPKPWSLLITVPFGLVTAACAIRLWRVRVTNALWRRTRGEWA